MTALDLRYWSHSDLCCYGYGFCSSEVTQEQIEVMVWLAGHIGRMAIMYTVLEDIGHPWPFPDEEIDGL